MFIKNLKIALRALFLNKTYALISILGLSVGISGSTLIALYMQDEMSYDLHHEKKDRIFRVTTVMDFNGEMDVAVTNMALGPTLVKDYPEVENYVRFYGGSNPIDITVDAKTYSESGLYFTDSTLFDIFSYEFVSGSKEDALTKPLSMVLSSSMAHKLFGDEDPINKEVKLNNTILHVTAVIEDAPTNSEIRPNAFISLTTMPPGFHAAHNEDWFRISFHTYLLFKEPIEPAEFKPKLDEVNEKYVVPWAEANGIVASQDYSITPLKDVHFDNKHAYDHPKGSWTYIYIFSALALFLLIIAAINYINLSMAQQMKRAKEVGVRKTLGSSKSALIVQFLTESLLITLIAMVIGLALTEIFINPFNVLTGKAVNAGNILSKEILLTELGVLLFIGIIAGSYPALILSSFNPVHVLKGGLKDGSGVGFFRKSLILVQFAFSIFMISGTLLIDRQMRFMKEMDLGFDREHLVRVKMPADTALQRQLTPWIDELEQHTGIAAISRTSPPTNRTGELMFRLEQDGEMKEQAVNFMFVDDQFIEVLGLELIDGRNFSTEFATDRTSAFIVNETAARQFGWENESLDKRVQWGLMANGQATNDGKVIGLVNDFNFMSLHNPLSPLILCYNPNGGRDVTIRFTTGDFTKTIDDIKQSWTTTLNHVPFELSFFNQELERNYVEETRMHKVFAYFAFISILLSCLGLFALLSYSIETRSKEIGIRKVLGASLSNLSWVIARDFAILLLIAFLIASPINYVLLMKWLDNFAYSAPFGFGSYILSLVLTGLLCLIAISYHIVRLNHTDPVESLRDE